MLLITISKVLVLGNETIPLQLHLSNLYYNTLRFSTEFNNSSLSKELISNTVSSTHLLSTLMIMASKRDFPLNVSLNTKLNYIHYPQSYRMTLLQVSSDMHKVFSNTDSAMYRIQLAVKRIPGYIKIILKLFRAGSSTMIKRMLPRSFDNIVRILNENKNLFTGIMGEFVNLSNLLNEINQLPIDLSLKFNNYSSDKTDLILYNKFNSKNALENISIKIQQITKQFENIIQLIINLDIKTKFDLSANEDIIRIIPVLYNIEIHAYFLYQLSNIYTNLLDRYILDQTSGMTRYIVLSTDEERYAVLLNLSKKSTNILYEVEKIFLEHQNEFKTSISALQEAYENLFNEFYDRSSTSKILEIK